jgi:SAM-dependent methyltransferase
MQMQHKNLLFLAILACLVSCSGGSPATPGGNDSLPDSVAGKRLSLETELDFEAEAESYETSDRENWQKPEALIARLGDLSDKVVADIGAGTGYFAFRIAEKAQKVIAIDIEKKFLDYINKKQKKNKSQGIANIETRLTKPEDPALGVGEASVVITVNTYHLIENRLAYFQKVRQALPEGGRLVVVDYKKEKLPVGPAEEEKLAPEVVVKELSAAGFSNISIDLKTLPYQYFIIAE